MEEYLAERSAATGATVQEMNTRTERLRYMYTHTLGCPNTFELRREELAVRPYCLHDICDAPYAPYIACMHWSEIS